MITKGVGTESIFILQEGKQVNAMINTMVCLNYLQSLYCRFISVTTATMIDYYYNKQLENQLRKAVLDKMYRPMFVIRRNIVTLAIYLQCDLFNYLIYQMRKIKGKYTTEFEKEIEENLRWKRFFMF